MRFTPWKHHMVAATLVFAATNAPPVAAQPAQSASRSLSAAIVDGAAHWARNVLNEGGPLLLDSAALHKAMPNESPAAIAKHYGNRARVVALSEAMTCVNGTPRCEVVEHGAIVSVTSVDVKRDSATADVKVRWSVKSERRGNVLVSNGVRLRLARGAAGWRVVGETRLSQS